MAKFKAQSVQRGDSIDYTPAAAVAAGDVVFIGPLCGVAKLDIKANELGALGVAGVFDFVKGSVAFALGESVYWDADAQKAAKSGSYAGVCIKAAAAGDAVVRVLINEGAPSEAASDASGSASGDASDSGSSTSI